MSIPHFFHNAFTNSFRVQEKMLEQTSLLDIDDYFRVKYFKSVRFSNLVNKFQSDSPGIIKGFKLVLGRNFALKNWLDIKNYLNVESVEFLDSEFFFENNSETEFIAKCEFLSEKILLTTNHDICRTDVNSLKNLQQFFLSCDKTIFAGWDWDNHHNLQISSIYGLNSDFYFPSQRANEYELSRVSNLTYFIPPSAYEWSKDFLLQNQNAILDSERPIDIFGTFNLYSRFPYRNQVITTLNRNIPEIRFIPDYSQYLTKTDTEKLLEWCDAKWHWIVPTFNAVSVRAFYALISGVGVILPVEFKSFEEFKLLDERDVIWYNAHDVMDPTRVKQEANFKFHQSGKDGVIRRHQFALNHHNLNNRVADMLDIILKNLMIPFTK